MEDREKIFDLVKSAWANARDNIDEVFGLIMGLVKNRMSRQEAAKFLGVSVGTLYNHEKSGKITPYDEDGNELSGNTARKKVFYDVMDVIKLTSKNNDGN